MPYQHIGVIGGGTAGYFAAIALKRASPARRVTVVESSKIPIIGVGEATTPPLVAFLHYTLGIDVVDFYARVRPTWKLGIQFTWGARPFQYPFGSGDVTEAMAYDGALDACSLTSMLMANHAFPVLDDAFGPRSLLTDLWFAYHLDNKRFVAYLADHARKVGVEHLDRTVTDVAVANGSIDHLVTAEGDQPRFDLYVDATGFRSLLIEKALGSPFQSYASTLLCDRAVVADVPHGGKLKPYTHAETMDAGWCWAIPQVDCDHRGYVYSSAHISDDEAEAEMRRKNPGMGKTWSVKFRSGRHREVWIGNACAIGNAYGFVEPLESTALHVVILEVMDLVRELARLDREGGEPDRARLGKRLGDNWDYLRWFLGIHYRFNSRLDTPFWQTCRRDVDISGFESVLAQFREGGPLTARMERDARDRVFGPFGTDVLLLGQGVPCALPTPQKSRDVWQATSAARAAYASAAWPQERALELMLQRPDILREMVYAPHGWIASAARELEAMGTP